MDPNAAVTSASDRTRILKAATSIGVLGSGAHSAPRIMAALCNPNVTAVEVAALVAKEPALYARVLRVANSAYYRQSRAISTVERALVLLGLDAVRGIAAAVCLDRTVPRGTEAALVDMSGLVHHSIATAAAAEAIARLRHPDLVSDAFIAGLLHNLGIPAQVQLDPAGVKAMIQARRTDGTGDMRALEAEFAAVGHEECLAVIFQEWRLPEPMTAAVRHHHEPLAAPEAHRNLAALLHLGATTALEMNCTFALEPKPIARNLAAMALLGTDPVEIDELVGTLPERVAQLGQALLTG